MTKPLRLRQEAEQEATEARRWYEDISDRVAAGFVRDLDQTMQAVRTRPLSSEALAEVEGVRMRILKSYPYVVFFRDLPEAVEVLAIAHNSREPDYWAGRAR